MSVVELRFSLRRACRLLLAGSMLFAVQTASSKDEISAERYRSSGLNGAFKLKGKSISEYLKFTREMVAKARVDLVDTDRERVIDGNAPFDLTPSKTCPAGKSKPFRRGILLTHGLTDSPYFMRSLGRFFQDNCFRVLAVLLPGHGTRPGDLLEVKWQEWLEAERFGIDALAQEADQIYLLGFSTGGTLSLYQSLEDQRIRGLFFFSPAIKVSTLAIMANWHEAYDWLAPKSLWLDIMPDEDPFKYESFPANAADQIHLLTTQLRAKMKKKIMIPTFVAVSEDDATVETPATLDFFKLAIHPLSTLVLYSTRKDASVPEVSPDKVVVVDSAVPQHHIISSAHTALVVPSEDPHYGVRGDYANCLHYYPKQEQKYRLCKDKKESSLGEITEANLKRGVVQRLMYNPHFDSLKLTLRQFVESLPND